MEPFTSEPSYVYAFLNAIHASKKAVRIGKNQTIFLQGEPGDAMFYIETGSVKLTVTSRTGKEATVAILQRGEFCGESCIALQQPCHSHSAVALTETQVLRIDGNAIAKALGGRTHPMYVFISSLLRHNASIQRDLALNLVESGEKRLARILLAMSRLNEGRTPPFPKITQQELANMAGITRQRTNAILKRLRKAG